MKKRTKIFFPIPLLAACLAAPAATLSPFYANAPIAIQGDGGDSVSRQSGLHQASLGMPFLRTSASGFQESSNTERLATAKPGNPGQDRQQARELNQRGLDALRHGDAKKASDTLTQAAKLAPLDAEILGNLGYAQYQQGLLDAALGTLLTAYKAQPGRALTLQNIGLVYAEMGDAPIAAKYFFAYIKTARNAGVAVDALQKWALDPARPKRARAAQAALDLFRDANL